VSKPMKMADGTSHTTEAEYRRLLSELDRLEQEQRELDLRDEHAVDACQRSLEALRKQIAALRGPDAGERRRDHRTTKE
jgi:hypothetical protein